MASARKTIWIGLSRGRNRSLNHVSPFVWVRPHRAMPPKISGTTSTSKTLSTKSASGRSTSVPANA